MENLAETLERIEPLWNTWDCSVWEIPPAQAVPPGNAVRACHHSFAPVKIRSHRNADGGRIFVTCFLGCLCVEFVEFSIRGCEPLEQSERINAMSARLRHRGPDSHGTFRLPHLALAIRRLSIIDLETGNQPLSNETGEITLVFNGEIYNYRDLREGLIKRGHLFKTHSDGEVILHLYEEQGADCLRQLNGMFAIALWDGRAHLFLLARDRAGEKPLYYWCGGQTPGFRVGSEIPF